MQNPSTFISRPYQVQAFQLTRENIADAIYFIGKHTNHRITEYGLRFEDSMGGFPTCQYGQWIVNDPRRGLVCMTNEEFLDDYIPVNHAGVLQPAS